MLSRREHNIVVSAYPWFLSFGIQLQVLNSMYGCLKSLPCETILPPCVEGGNILGFEVSIKVHVFSVAFIYIMIILHDMI